MRIPKSPRYQGRISTWKDNQGFGFITPNGGGPAVFFHISSVTGRGRRPAGDEIVTYDLAINEEGHARAENVAYVRNRDLRPSSHQAARIPPIAAFAFLALVAASVFIGKLPALLLFAYLGMSALAFFAYYLDKQAARNHRWRTRESTLHLIGLAGGWPGALLAQGLFRHKSSKPSFQAAFRLTVIVNCAAFGWLLSPLGSKTLQVIFLLI
jgi:uncharacterized membrane protein YsdA (DUF1294 family)/cold shock CspA family protein